MDAFEQTVQKAKELFDVACQKTGEAVSLQKLKFDLTTLENKLQKAYAKLGEILYFQDDSTSSPTVAEQKTRQEISSLLSAIEAKKEEISSAKGERGCSHCNHRFSKPAKFCPVCGAALD